MGTSASERRYGGKTTAQRRAERREKLLDTGLELFGTRGYAATSIELLCASAGLNARYFYEEFESRERLLRAIYDRHVEAVFTVVLTAVESAEPTPAARLSAGLSAFVQNAFADPHAARVNYFEMVGVSAELETRRREVLRMYGEMIAGQFEDLLGPGIQPPGGDLHIAAVALVAATDGLIIDRLSDSERGAPAQRDLDQIVTSLTTIWSAAVAAIAAEAPEAAAA